MASQGSGGAYEISQRMTAAIGWGATADFKEDWVWDQSAETYTEGEMAETLRKANPQVSMCVGRDRFQQQGLWSIRLLRRGHLPHSPKFVPRRPNLPTCTVYLQ